MRLDIRSVSLSTTPLGLYSADILPYLVDPTDDCQITSGALAGDLEVAFTVPHWAGGIYTKRSHPDPFGDGTPPAPDPLRNYFTPTSQEALVPFYGFQTQFEGLPVS